jgi:two-component system sensor kinase FixL
LSSKGDVKPEEIGLASLIENTVSLVFRDGGGDRVTLQISINLGAEKVFTDAVLLQQVIFNLVRNSVQAMSGTGGTISVRAEVKSDTEVLIAVEDNGPGLAQEVADNLFTAFVTTHSDGMGVGLSICRTIVEKLGGHIWAESNPTGTTFFFTVHRRACDAYHARPALT